MKIPYPDPIYVPKRFDGDDAGSGAPAGAHEPASEIAPRTVIRGESSQDGTEKHPALEGARSGSMPLSGGETPQGGRASGDSPQAATTDWLNCTFPLHDDRESLNVFFRGFVNVVGDEFGPIVERGSGLHGWHRSFKLGRTEALFAIGGQSGTAFLSLPGGACTRIALATWPNLVAFLSGRYHARITRWDGAVDDFDGVHSVDWAVEQYKNGGFSTGGNRPKVSQMGNWLEPDGSGRTFYVGSRKNGKFMRIYEKGKQLGDPASKWVRWELELHSRDRDIPWEVVLEPGRFVAGAYACTSWITEDASRVRTAKTTAKIGYEALMFHARRGYGPLLNVMMEIEGEDAEKVVAKLRREGIPKRLDMPLPPEMELGAGNLIEDEV